MMYIHYCKTCKRIHLLNGHKQTCPACEQSLVELLIPYLEYVALSEEERQNLLADCADEARLRHLATTYRMARYVKKTPYK